MKRPADAFRALPFVSTWEVKGRRYWRFRKGGKTVMIRVDPDKDPAGFMAAYNAALEGRAAPKTSKRTFDALIARYEASERFTRLAERTQADYRSIMALISRKIGGYPVSAMARPDVLRMQDGLSATPRRANYAVQVMSVLLGYSMDLGWRADNPAYGVRLLRRGDKPDLHRPWTQEAREAFEANAGPLARLAYELGICTGQRAGDLLRMKWADVEDGGIHVRQGKTGAALWIPFTPRFAAYLATVERRGAYILARDLRRPVDYPALSRAVLKARKGNASEGFTIHGWRYTCAADLAALGKSDEEIAAITGHQSLAMVRKYAGAARQKARARKAQEGRG